MRRRLGFTIIELLIVLSILGILATVLLPRVLAARKAALEGAAQAYSSSVATALSAVLATDETLQPSDVEAGTFNCGQRAAATETVTVSGTAFNFGWGPAPAAVTACVVNGDDTAGTILVDITTNVATYSNGVRQ